MIDLYQKCIAWCDFEQDLKEDMYKTRSSSREPNERDRLDWEEESASIELH